MDSQKLSKSNNYNNSSSSTSFESAVTNIRASSSDLLQDQDYFFLRYGSTLSPLKASSVAQGSLGLNSAPVEFKSPCMSHYDETQILGRPQGTQSLGVEISQSGKEGNCLGEAPADSGISNSQKPLPEMPITDDINQVYAIFEECTQYNSFPMSIEPYLEDPGDIGQMYAAEKSLSDPILSREDILKIDWEDVLGDKAEESLPLTNDPTNFEQYSHDQLSKDIKGCEDYNQMVSTSHVTLENILQDDTVALKYDGKRRRCLQHEDGNSEELDQRLSASKKMKKASATGCKRCGCKKTKCLQLYCHCFAHGIYCIDPCGCQGCLNRPEYSDKVRESRQQVQSHNPHAFSPKIIQSSTDNKENINLTTPSSARHKKGCNCKKSTCAKRYCECYEANVGCSSACRCEECKNTYGKKEGLVALEQHSSSKERVSSIAQEGLENTLDTKLQWVTNMRYDLSPATPSMQYSDQSFLQTNEMLGIAPGALFQLTPLSNPEPQWTNVSQSQLSYGCTGQLPGGSIGWHNSLVTPGTRVGEAKHLQ